VTESPQNQVSLAHRHRTVQFRRLVFPPALDHVLSAPIGQHPRFRSPIIHQLYRRLWSTNR